MSLPAQQSKQQQWLRQVAPCDSPPCCRMGRLMADIGDIVVTAHSDDADDDDGMVPASSATASGATASGATTSGATPSGATASGGASPPDAFEDPFEGVDPAALAAMEAAAVKAAAVDEDAYIANDPRAQERAREASAMLQASLKLVTNFSTAGKVMSFLLSCTAMVRVNYRVRSWKRLSNLK